MKTMSFFLNIALMGIWSCGSVRHTSSSHQSRETYADPGCTLTTTAAWQDFLSNATNDQRWVDTCEDSICDSNFFHIVEKNVQSVLEKCTGTMTHEPVISKCTDNLRSFLPSWTAQHDPDSYGFLVDAKTYLKGQDGPDKPKDLMSPPVELVAALPELNNVKAAAQKYGWKYLIQDSAIDNYRIFFFMPDAHERFDRWILLNLDDKKNILMDMPMSVIGIEKQDGTGNKLPKVKLNFRDYQFVKTGDKFDVSAKTTENGKCFACHVSGTRQLIKFQTAALEADPVFGEAAFGKAASIDFANDRLKDFNDKLASYGLPDWDGKIVPESFGPKLGENIGCTACHNGVRRGGITVATSTDQLSEKLVRELSMMPNAELSALVDKSILHEADVTEAESQQIGDAYSQHEKNMAELSESRFPAFRAWALENRCD